MTKRRIRFCCAVCILCMLIGLFSACGVATGQTDHSGVPNHSGEPNDIDEADDDEDDEDEDDDEDVRIVADRSKSVTYEQVDNGYLNMDIPAGWRFILHPAADPVHYTFQVVDPENRDYQLCFSMKCEGFLSSEKERKWYASYYPSAPMSKYPAVDPQNTEGFFKVYTKAAAVDGLTIGDFRYPTINDFTVLEKIGTAPVGGDIVRASYKNGQGQEIGGVFTATPKLVSLYYVHGVNVYNVIYFTAPADDLINWTEVFEHCISTISFTDAFVEAYYRLEKSMAQTSAEISRINSETGRIITDGWNNRQKSYDIISQKQSDATLGYERVYDTETNEIYKAYNGFNDVYSGERYKPVTEDMYANPISGYIEK